jgi:hypothetical protein
MEGDEMALATQMVGSGKLPGVIRLLCMHVHHPGFSFDTTNLPVLELKFATIFGGSLFFLNHGVP